MDSIKPLFKLQLVYGLAAMAAFMAGFFVLSANRGICSVLYLTFMAVAFGAQPLFSLLFRKAKDPRYMAVSGVCLCAIGALLHFTGFLALAFVALGCALVASSGALVGAKSGTTSTIMLGYTGLGCALGAGLGANGHLGSITLTILILLIVFLLWRTKGDLMQAGLESKPGLSPSGLTKLSAVFSLFAIVTGSAAAAMVSYTMVGAVASIAFGVVVFCGVAMGLAGINMFCWKSFTIVSIVISMALLIPGFQVGFTLFGIFFLTMAIAALSKTVESFFAPNTALGFGLTRLAIFAGVIISII